MEAIATVQKNWKVIQEAPFAVLSLVGLAAVIAFSTARFLDNEKISIMESRLTAHQETIQKYKDGLAGATPDEARAKMDNLEKRLSALEPRILKQDQLALFAAIAATAPGGVNVAVDMASPETQQISRQIESSLTSTGWVLSTTTIMGLSNPPASGFAIISKSSGSRESAVLSRAFDAIGVAHELRVDPVIAQSGTMILITKPEL